MADQDIVTAQTHTLGLVFGVPQYLTYGERFDDKIGSNVLETTPFSWYRSTKLAPIKGRWVYVFCQQARPLVGGSSEATTMRLLHEFYVDKEGGYFQSNESDLFESPPGSLRLALHSVAKRKAAIEEKAKSGGGAPNVQLPYFIGGYKCALYALALAFPLPSACLDPFTAALWEGQLPWITEWDSKTGKAKVNVLGATTIKRNGGSGSSTASVDMVPVVEPLELAVRTNQRFCEELKTTRELARSESERVTFAREMHQLIRSSSALEGIAKRYVRGGSLKLIEAEYEPANAKLAAASKRFEARARVLVAFMESALFRATQKAHRINEDDPSVDPPSFAYFVNAVDGATEQLIHSASGKRLLEDMARGGGHWSEWTSDYVFPNGALSSRVESNVKAVLPSIITLLAKLAVVLDLELLDAATELVGVNLTALTGHPFVAIHDIPELIPKGYFVEYEDPGDVIPGRWMSKKDLAKIKKTSFAQAKSAFGDRHLLVERVMDDVGLALDALNLLLTSAELAQKVLTGTLSFRKRVDQYHARIALGVAITKRYAHWLVGEAAALALVEKLAVVGALVSFHSSMLTVTDSWESYDRGQYGKAAGQAAAGWFGLAAGVLAFIPGAGWAALAAGLIAVAGGVVDSSFTETPLEQFFKFFEWGEGGNPKETTQKPSFSSFPFTAWKGNVKVQREALSRILCAFEIETHYDGPRRAVIIRPAYVEPKGMFTVTWRTLDEGASETQSVEVSGTAFSGYSSMKVFEPPKVQSAREAEVSVSLDLKGDGSIVIPSRKKLALVLSYPIRPEGKASSLEVEG